MPPRSRFSVDTEPKTIREDNETGLSPIQPITIILDTQDFISPDHISPHNSDNTKKRTWKRRVRLTPNSPTPQQIKKKRSATKAKNEDKNWDQQKKGKTATTGEDADQDKVLAEFARQLRQQQ